MIDSAFFDDTAIRPVLQNAIVSIPETEMEPKKTFRVDRWFRWGKKGQTLHCHELHDMSAGVKHRSRYVRPSKLRELLEQKVLTIENPAILW